MYSFGVAQTSRNRLRLDREKNPQWIKPLILTLRTNFVTGIPFTSDPGLFGFQCFVFILLIKTGKNL